MGGSLKIGQYIGVLVVLRLKKSGIESVILAGSSLLAFVRGEISFLSYDTQSPLRAQRAIFQGF